MEGEAWTEDVILTAVSGKWKACTESERHYLRGWEDGDTRGTQTGVTRSVSTNSCALDFGGRIIGLVLERN